MTAIERQVERIAAIWPVPRMSRFTRDEYAQALADFDPDAVAAAVNVLRDTWMKDVVPPPGEFVVHAKAATPRRGRKGVHGDGAGCPQCHAEYWEGEHAEWRGDGTIIACTEHGWTWPGSTHVPDEDVGEYTPEEWRTRAEFGRVIQAHTETGGHPEEVLGELVKSRRAT